MSLLRAVVYNAWLLSIFAVVTAVLLSATYLATFDKIEQAQREQEAKALAELMQPIEYDNDLLSASFPLSASDRNVLNIDDNLSAYYATNNDQSQAIILPSIAPDGYSGAIKMLIGIDTSGRITGLRVTDHKETPGLGDKVSLKRSPWVLSFNNKGLDNVPVKQWAVKKEGGQFDAFTGATITPRAVINQARATLELFNERFPKWSDSIKQQQASQQ